MNCLVADQKKSSLVSGVKKDIVIQDLLHIHKDARLNPLALEVYRRDDTTSGVSTTNWSWSRGQADKVWAVVASEDMILCWNVEGLGLERDVLDRATEVIAEGGGIELSWESGGLKVGRCEYIIMKYTTFVKPSGWWRSPFPLDGYSLWLYPSHDVDSEGYLINLVKTPLWDCVTLSEQAMWAHIIICLIWLNISRQCHPSGAQLLLNGIMAGPRVLLWIEIDSDVQVWKQFSWDISSNL